MRSAGGLVIVGSLFLCGCGESAPPADTPVAADPALQPEFIGTWQAGGTFPGDCTDLVCPAQFSFRLDVRGSGACAWKGLTRTYRTDPNTGEWDYESWHPYGPTVGTCTWTAPDDWHIKFSLRQSEVWSGKLNGSILEVTAPELRDMRVHFSRVNE
jgi:hypothetical protein